MNLPSSILSKRPDIPSSRIESQKSMITVSSIIPSCQDVSKSPILSLNLKRPNDLIEKLSKKGFTVEFQLYDNNNLIYLLCKSDIGDRILIKTETDPHLRDIPKIILERSIKTTSISKDIHEKVRGFCYISKREICIIEKNNPEQQCYIYNSTLSNVFEENIVPYFIINIEDINTIDEILIPETERIRQDLLLNLYEKHDSLKDAVENLAKVTAISDQFLKSDDFLLDNDIQMLISYYLKYRNLGTISGEEKSRYNIITYNLRNKKDLRDKIINSMNDICKMREQVNHLYENFLESIGSLMEEQKASARSISQ